MLTSDEISVWELAALISVTESPGCSVRDIAARWDGQKQTVSRACQALEKRDLLRREPAGDQLLSLTLTPAGAALARRLHIQS